MIKKTIFLSICVVVVLGFFTVFTAMASKPISIDKKTGLIKAKGFEVVKANCTACHSAKLVTQNKMNRARWLETIRWMQETQGLWQFAPAVEKEILDYLSTNYKPTKAYRRTPLKVNWK
jgi:hypothetical protein